MKREKSHFYQDPKSDQNKGNLHRSRIHQFVRDDYILDTDHIQSARHDVDITNTQEIQGCTNRSQYQVVKSGGSCPIATHGDQSISSQCSHFDQHVKIERIPR